jgi:hypothetical protein
MRPARLAPALALLCSAVALAGCARDSAGLGAAPTGGGLVAGALASALPGRKPAEAAPAPDAAQIAAKALAANAGPVVLVQFGATGTPFAMAERGRNGAMRTFVSPDNRALVLRDGLLAASRGFGRDLMSSDTGESATLIAARQAGTAKRVQYYLDGDGRERPLPMECSITPGAPVTQSAGGASLTVTPVSETCAPANAENSYMVGADGRVLASVQWLGPRMGYLHITHLRD